ncbi:hypothetical protein F5B22DRAFT_524522 [Xylaria bambusicola]|uniref:uncharacterized protein n=1 Tax=Xylaria bambusicola TaxID=326684 RepID=UPI00200732F9|nr:uncharacterized protein F5B22DRAFT_524522 [Xylaria bambusicola]KAI0505438.1 hypothetical protein F5B22DRAFT_524522 [Xylaria bambusicola]
MPPKDSSSTHDSGYSAIANQSTIRSQRSQDYRGERNKRQTSQGKLVVTNEHHAIAETEQSESSLYLSAISSFLSTETKTILDTILTKALDLVVKSTGTATPDLPDNLFIPFTIGERVIVSINHELRKQDLMLDVPISHGFTVRDLRRLYYMVESNPPRPASPNTTKPIPANSKAGIPDIFKYLISTDATRDTNLHIMLAFWGKVRKQYPQALVPKDLSESARQVRDRHLEENYCIHCVAMEGDQHARNVFARNKNASMLQDYDNNLLYSV